MLQSQSITYCALCKSLNILFQYGSPDVNGNWNGMIKEVMIGPKEGGADFAVADLSVTSSRGQAVQFSMPWMTLGKPHLGYMI